MQPHVAEIVAAAVTMFTQSCAVCRAVSAVTKEAQPPAKAAPAAKSRKVDAASSPAGGKVRALPKSLSSTPAPTAEPPPSAARSQPKPRSTPAGGKVPLPAVGSNAFRASQWLCAFTDERNMRARDRHLSACVLARMRDAGHAVAYSQNLMRPSQS